MTRMTTRGVIALLTLFPVAAGYAAVPIPHCRQGDKTESGLQGLTTPAEIAAGKATQGFNCNADILGQYQGEGASWQLTAWKNCAYFDQRLAGQAGSTNMAHPGTAVVDVSNPASPQPVKWLADNAMLDPWESLKVNAARQLLAGAQRPPTTNDPCSGFAIYDISADCKQPVLKFAGNVAGSCGHTGQWAPDGKTYYVTPLRNTPSIIAIDTTDVANPAVLPNGIFTAPTGVAALPRWHDVEFSKDGNTAYVTMFGTGATAGQNGLLILDVSDFQGRKGATAAYRVISQLTWDDGSVGAQNALPITIKGKPYILFSDEGDNGATACSQGKAGSGFPRLVDISDQSKPVTVAKIQLDIHDPANCTTAINTPVSSPTSSGFFGFSCHYCNVDDADNATIAACNCFAAGLRFFDISNINAIREIAYLKPPAQGAKAMPGSQYANSTPAGFVRNFDWATSKPSFPKDRGMTSGDLWTTSQDNGFMVVKLAPNATSVPGGGCASVDASLGGLLAFGLARLWRRRRSRSAS
jgi:hypothetical protein